MRIIAALFVSLVLLTSCSSWQGEKDSAPLEGERKAVLQTLELEKPAEKLSIPPLPEAVSNTVWGQALAYPSHNPGHLTLSGGLTNQVWTKSIGKGANKENPIVTAPIIAGNMVYAMDTRGRVNALTADTGKTIWQAVTRGDSQDKDELSAGGGLAYGRGQIIVTNGSRDVIALNADNGELIWRQTLQAPLRGAPNVAGGRAYVTDAMNHVVAIDTNTGKTTWTFESLAQDIGILGTPSPAIDDRNVVAALSSGLISAVGIVDGQSAWNGRFTMGSAMRTGEVADLRDVAGAPVIDRGRVMVVNSAGYMVVIDAQTGLRLWQKDIGGTGQIWPAGEVIYVMTHSGLSARLASSGAALWHGELPQYKDEEDKKNPITWYGPYLLSGKLYAFGSAGQAVVIDPATGETISTLPIADHLSAPPAVANDMTVMIDDSGRVSVWR